MCLPSSAVLAEEAGNQDGATEVGSNTVYFRVEKEGYQSEDGTLGVQINPVDIRDQVRAGLKSSYAYTGSPVQFALPYDKIKEWSIVYVNSDGEAGYQDLYNYHFMSRSR